MPHFHILRGNKAVHAVGAGIVGGAVALAVEWQQETNASDKVGFEEGGSSSLGRTSTDGNSSLPLASVLRGLQDGKVNLIKLASVSCEQFFRRIDTIRMFERQKALSSLRSEYQVQWNAALGEGGFGAVYAATNRKTGEKVAIKQISKKFTRDMGFQREMEALMHIRAAGGHPNICGLHQNFDEGNYYYLAFDIVSGGEMFDHLIRSGAYSEEDASRLVKEIASALSFLHGIGCVHGDLKPENIMLSTENRQNAVIKLIDFGCAQVTMSDDERPGVVGLTEAYCPPEIVKLRPNERKRIDPPQDMWALGIILHIMLVGCHPFDVEGGASDADIVYKVVNRKSPVTLEPNSPYTQHLSESAIDLIRKLLTWDQNDRISALEMLEHPWVRGLTAKKQKISGSDERLSKFRVFKSRLEATVFADIINWCDLKEDVDASKKTSLIERSFRKLDRQNKGFISAMDLKKATGNTAGGDGSEDASLSLSAFSDLLSENMKDRYFAKGQVIFEEGDKGNHMFFINSGKVEVTGKDGFRTELGAGSTVGESALLSSEKIRNGTVTCLTPVHTLEVSREYFEKYMKASDTGLNLKVREKDKWRGIDRAKNILRNQKEMRDINFNKDEAVFKKGEPAKGIYIMEEGNVSSVVEGSLVETFGPGQMFGTTGCITQRLRNSSAFCTTDVCKGYMMDCENFRALLDGSPLLKSTAYDFSMRREFRKAVTALTKRKFPTNPNDLRVVFDEIDLDKSGTIKEDEVRTLLVLLEPTIPKALVRDIMHSLDIDESGTVDFDEFLAIFEMSGHVHEDPKEKVKDS